MQTDSQRGALYGLSAYTLWGLLPLYLMTLHPAGALEILANRIVWSVLVCLILVALLRKRGPLVTALRNPRTRALLALAAALVALNWGIYVLAVTTGHVVESALGYYINPLFTVLLGVVVLGERLRPMQWSAVALGGIAVLALTLEYGRLPWIALSLAATFGCYGLVKKQVGPGVDALTGLSVETLLLAPFAATFLGWLIATGRDTYDVGAGHALLLAASGVVTAVPLLLFAAAARRVPLSTLGLMQYIGPTLQFIIGVFVAHESMSSGRWLGFGLIWAALVLLTWDSLRHARRPVVPPPDC